MVIRFMCGMFFSDGLRFDSYLDYLVNCVTGAFIFILYSSSSFLIFVQILFFLPLFSYSIMILTIILTSLPDKCFELRTIVRHVRDILSSKFRKFIVGKMVTLYSLIFCNFH